VSRDSLLRVDREVVVCERCPRLRAHCRRVAREKRAAYRDDTYWGRPVPSFGARDPRILVVGLAPGAHGANRTGRLFTGDGSGDFLFAALHRVGLANQPVSRSRGDGLVLLGVRISAAARCAPPGNRPARDELERCRSFLVREVRLLPRVRVIVALGGIAFDSVRAALGEIGCEWPRPRPRFAHGLLVPGEGRRPDVLASYHPSRQNTQTRRLTPGMLDAVLADARDRALRTAARSGLR
jgi:uracil-DNA glycosylase family 4